MATEPTYPTYVVNQDWTTFTANQPGASYTGNPNTYVYAVTGFGSIFKTIVDGNLDNPTRVPGAVGVEIGEETLASPLPLYTEDGITVAVVKGDFVEEAAIAQTGANYTLDFSSIYDTEVLSTKFVGSFVAAEGSNVGFVVSSKTVYFGAEAVVVDEQITNRTTITLNRTDTANKWGKDSTFTVGGDFLSDYTEEEAFATATAIVKNTDLTVNGAVWVGSGWTATGSADELFENSTDAVRYFLTVDDSVVNAASLQVRNTGELTVTGSTVNTVDVTIRHNASFTNTDLTVNAGPGNFNVYGETDVTATVTLTNSTLATNRTTDGNTDTQFNEFVIGKPGNANRKGVVELIGSKITGITTSTPGEQEGDDPIITVAKADITVNVGGTLDIDANSSVEAKNVVNKGSIIIKVKNDPESPNDQDWISATSFTNDNETGAITIDTTHESLTDWNGVKRVIYAEEGSEGDAFEAKITVADGYKVRTSLGKVAIAKGVDYSVYYVNHANDEVAQFAETKTINYPAANTDYYVAFNAFSDAGNAIGKRETQTTGDPDPKLTTTTILFDGTAEGLSYTGEIQDFDGLTFLRYGVDEDDDATTQVIEGTYDVTVAMTGAEQEKVERVIVKGFTVGEGVTFSADSVVQNGADARTDINGELKILKSNVEIVPDHPELGYVPSFRVGGGALYVHEGAKLTSENQGNLDVNATNRVPGSGTPIPATMTVEAADVNLYQLTIGSNATVTLKDMKIDDDTETEDFIEGGAHFNKLQLKNPESSDFAKPKLVLQNTDVIVSEVFDSRYGTVDMDMKSTLRVLVDDAQIGGGTFNLTVNGTASYDEETGWTYTGDLADDLGFYKLVYAPLSADVVLTCNGVVNPDDKQEGVVTDKTSGEVMGEYMYTSLGGKGLFVMKESLRANLYVNEAWTTEQYTFGDRIADGIYFGVNGFNTLTEAFTTASSRNGNCTITLLSDVTEEGLKAPFYKFKGSVTVTGNHSVTWDVTDQYSTYYNDGAAYFLRDGESTPTVTFNDGTSFKVTRTTTTTKAGVLYVGYDAQDKTGAAFKGTIQDTTIYVSRWANLTVTGTVIGGLASQIYLRKHGKLLIDGTGKTFEANESQVSTASSALIYGGTATVLNSVISIGDQLMVVNRNALNEADVNMPAETVVFGATNSTISAKSFSGGPVTPTENNDLTDGVTSLVKSTMTIENGVDNYGTFYVGVAVKAKDILDEDDKVIKNTVEVDESITGEAAASTLIVGTTVSNNGVIELKYSTANITGELKNTAGGVITITDSTVTAGSVLNRCTTAAPATITVGENGVLSAGSVSNSNNTAGAAAGILNVIDGGTVITTNANSRIYNYGTMNLDDAKFQTSRIQNMKNCTINIDGAVTFINGEDTVRGSITNYSVESQVHKDAIINMGVSNTEPGFVNVDIIGGTVAFSKASLTFDMAATSVNADEAVVSAKLSGGTIFVDKAGITLTDSGFKVVDTPADPEANPPVAEVSHMVWNDTNFIKIGASGSLTLDDVAGWDNSDDEYADAGLYDSLVVTGLDIAAGGSLTMDWSQCLTVNGTVTAAGSSAITVTLNPLEVYTSLNTDKLVIADVNATEAYYSTFVKDYEAFFTVHSSEEAGFDVTGLYLDASKFVKVSQDHDPVLEDGWYNQFNTVPGSQDPKDQGAVDSEAGVVLGIDGAFTNVFLKDKVTLIVGSTDEEATLTFNGIFAGGFDVSAMVKDTEYEAAGPAKLNMKIHAGETNVAISAGTFSNAVVVGGDLVKIAGEETKVNYYRVGDVNTVIDGGIFTVTSAGGQRMIVGGEYYQAATIDGQRVSIGAANLTGDINLTISGGSFKGYDVYGGNYANQKTFGKYAMIDGSVTIILGGEAVVYDDDDPETIDDTKIVFATNTNGTEGGKIFAGSFGAGAITGDVTVTLTGNKDITLERLFGGCTGDVRKSTKELESNVEGNRILSFTGFTGKILNNKGEAAVIEGFDTVEISGVNELNFDVTDTFFNLDVTSWKFAADAEVSGTFAFDFTGDKVDMTALDAGFQLGNVTMTEADLANVSVGLGIGKVYDADNKILSLVTLS